MRTLFVALAVVIVSGVFSGVAGEYWDFYGTTAMMRAGDPAHAYAMCRALESRGLWLLDRGEVTSRCEAAAAEAVLSAVAAERFEPAAAHCSTVLAPPDTGYEQRVQSTCRGLGAAHAGFIARLVRLSDDERALDELTTAERLFGSQTDTMVRLRGLRAEAQAVRFERFVDAGNALAAFDTLRTFEPTAAAALLRRVESRVHDAWTLGVAGHIGGHNYPAVLELHERLRKELRPELRYRLALAYKESIQKLFWLPSTGDVRDALDAYEPPPAVAAEQTPIARRAVVTFENGSDRRMWVVLRGEMVDYRLPPIPPRGALRRAIRPGRYAQVVHSGTDVGPFVGVIQVPEAELRQAFTIAEGQSVRLPVREDGL